MGSIDRPSMLRLLAPLLLLGSVLHGAVLAPAKAHQIESALQYLDGDLQLSSSFSNGEPTQGAVVRLLNADGTPGQELGRTDAEGRLSLDLSSAGNGTVECVDGQGEVCDARERALVLGATDAASAALAFWLEPQPNPVVDGLSDEMHCVRWG